MDKIEELKEKVANDPNSKLFVPLAEEYRKAGMLDEAISVLQEGIERQPKYTSAVVALGKIYLEKEMFTEARTEFEKVIAQVPDNLFAQRRLADVYKRLGDREKALEQYRRVLKLNPMDEEAQSILEELSKAPAAEVPAEASGDVEDEAPEEEVSTEGVTAEEEGTFLELDEDAAGEELEPGEKLTPLEELEAEQEFFEAFDEEAAPSGEVPGAFEDAAPTDIFPEAFESKTASPDIFPESTEGNEAPSDVFPEAIDEKNLPAEEIQETVEEEIESTEEIAEGFEDAEEEEEFLEAMEEDTPLEDLVEAATEAAGIFEETEPADEVSEVIEEEAEPVGDIAEALEEEEFLEALEEAAPLEEPVEAGTEAAEVMEEAPETGEAEEIIEEEASLKEPVEAGEEAAEVMEESPETGEAEDIIEEAASLKELVEAGEEAAEILEAAEETEAVEEVLEDATSAEDDVEIEEDTADVPEEATHVEAAEEAVEETESIEDISGETGFGDLKEIVSEEEPTVEKAEECTSHGQYDKAADIYREILARDPENMIAKQGLQELESLLKLVSTEKEVIIGRLEAFLQAIMKRKDELHRNT